VEICTLCHNSTLSSSKSIVRAIQNTAFNIIMMSEIATVFHAFLKHVEIQDRRQLTGLLLKNCFVGSEAVDAMIEARVTNKREDAVHWIRRLQKDLRMFRPVRGNQRFQDSKRHVYHLTVQDSIKDTASLEAITRNSNEDLSLSEKAKLFFQLAIVGDRKQGLKKYSSCFVGCDIVDRLVFCGLVKSRLDGVLLGRKLAREMELFDHVNRKHYFTDDVSLYCFAPGVLKVIYELQRAEKEHGSLFPAKQIKIVVAALNSKRTSSDSKLSAFERLIHTRARKSDSSIVSDAVEVSSDDDESVLSMPELSQSLTFMDDCKESVFSHSNSFDTLNDIILKQGGLQSDSMSLYSTFEDSFGFQRAFNNGTSIRLGASENIGDDGSRIKFTVRKEKLLPFPSLFQEKSLLCEDGSVVSEPDDLMNCSSGNVPDFKMLIPVANRRKGIPRTPVPLPEDQSTLYSTGFKFSSIVVENSQVDDDMTQITMDKCIATVASMDLDGDIVPIASTEEEGISQLLANSRANFKSLSPEIISNRTSSSDRQRHPNTYFSSKLSNQSTSMTSQSTSTPKQRISKILRKELWSCDDNVIGVALKELCESLEDDLPINGAHIVYCGGVLALKRTLEEHLHLECIQYYGCIALGKLASLDLDTQGAVNEMDGLPLVIQAMQRHVDSSRLQEAGRSALASICWRSDI
jgi:hypothetical protein